MQVCRGASISHLKNNCPFFCCPLFFKYLNPRVRINKIIAKEQTVDYHTNPSVLTSSIHIFIFLWTPQGFISPEHLLNFLVNVYAPTWLAFSRLLENAFANQKMILVIFAHASKAKLSSRFLSPPLRQREITPRKLKK